MGTGFSGIESFREKTIKLPFDNDLLNYKPELFNSIGSERLIVLNNQFFYITDLQHFNNVYVHKNLKLVLGYDPDIFKSMEKIYSLIHPEDHDFVLAFSEKTIKYSRDPRVKPLLLKDPFKITFSIDFRMKKSEGKYIRVNRLTSCLNLDRQGNAVYAIALYTDIDHLKKSNNISYSWTGDDIGAFSVDDITNPDPSSIFSHREIDVLKCLAAGMKGKEIACNLDVSEHTVISHRKNMLQKSKAKNTAELVIFAVNNGLILQ